MRILKAVIIGTVLVHAFARVMHAQAPSTGAAAAATAAKPATKLDPALVARFSGVWQGQYKNDHMGDGALALGLSADSVWHAELGMTMGSQTLDNRITNVEVAGHEIAFDAAFDITPNHITCRFAGQVDGEFMFGKVDCGHAVIDYSLKRTSGR